MFTHNPFVWDSSAMYINSWAIDINIYDEGKHLQVSNLANPVGIFIPEDTPHSTVLKTPNFIKPTKNSTDTSRLRYHTFNIDTPFSVAMIRIEPSEGKKFEVFVSAGQRPLPWQYNYTTVIPDFSSCKTIDMDGAPKFVNCTVEPYMFNVSSQLTGKTGKHFVGIRYLDSEYTEIRHRLRRDCGQGRRKKRSCVGVKDPPTMPIPTQIVIPEYNATTDVNYTLTISSSSCMYWSESKQKWTDHGCKVTRQCQHINFDKLIT